MSQELTDNPPGIWGLGEIGLPMFYKHATPLGLWLGQDARPTGVIVGFHCIYL